eukprot:jgi/Picre1/32347/NNA_007693.t1
MSQICRNFEETLLTQCLRYHTQYSTDATTSKADMISASLERQSEDVSVSAYRSMSAPRTEKFAKLLDEKIVDIEQLRELSWSGIPPEFRPVCWRFFWDMFPLIGLARAGSH